MPRKPRMLLKELAALWDVDADVRSHLRKFGSVLHVGGATFRPTVSILQPKHVCNSSCAPVDPGATQLNIAVS